MTTDSTILVAEDDSDDTALLKYAFKEAELKNPMVFVGVFSIAFLPAILINAFVF